MESFAGSGFEEDRTKLRRILKSPHRRAFSQYWPHSYCSSSPGRKPAGQAGFSSRSKLCWIHLPGNGDFLWLDSFHCNLL